MKIKSSHPAIFCRTLSTSKSYLKWLRKDFLPNWAVEKLHLRWAQKRFLVRRPRGPGTPQGGRHTSPLCKGSMLSDLSRKADSYPGGQSWGVTSSKLLSLLMQKPKLSMSTSNTFWVLRNGFLPQPFWLPLLIIEFSLFLNLRMSHDFNSSGLNGLP